MSTIQIQKEWQPSPAKNLVESLPVKEGKKLETNVLKCIVCYNLKTPFIFDTDDKPLVLKCIQCGHKSWASA